ncbi:MAG: ECF transporter S component [Oscillospiraceae bacterium]|nr:ECF transporter S component [Oscillospiraceae bacterium]
MKHVSISSITRTAVFLAILLVVQAVFKVLGQYVLGSIVNFILISSTILIGIYESIVIAILSPFLAFLLGFGPAIPQIVPIVMLANLSYVFVWYLLYGRSKGNRVIGIMITLAVSATVKFLILWLGVVKIIIPLLHVQKPQATVVAAAFSYPQLITATIGGLTAVIILPTIKRIMINDRV